MARRNRYRAEDRDEELEGVLPEEDAEDEDETVDAEDDDENIDAEDEDETVNAEDDDETIDAEDDEDDIAAEDEDEPTARKAKTARVSERKRSLALLRLEKQASRLGVRFNAQKAILNGTSPARARSMILKAASSRSRSMVVNPSARTAGRNFGGVTQKQAVAMWKKVKGKR